ncbi:MAG: stage III sporulation protein AG [Acetatifactor sp.]|nr:stage III sporulation protein AG [Acetatifactor sp.]
MGDVKKLFERVSGGKKLRKDQCLILVLVGMLLCVISLPVEKEQTKSGLLDTSKANIENKQVFEERDDDDYVSRWEEKLEESLRFVEGAGKVRVLIYVKESEEKILASEGVEETSDTAETDAAGGSRHVSGVRTDKEVVSTVDERGESVPLVVKTRAPCVEGVVVIAQGADKAQVRKDIIGAIQVLFDVDMNRISVIKMKTNNQ